MMNMEGMGFEPITSGHEIIHDRTSYNCLLQFLSCYW